jgi:methionyl-tRNA formyltransferase
VFGTVTETVHPTDTSGDVLGRLAVAGARLLVATLDGIEDGTLSPVPQPLDGVSHAPKLTVDDARVDWTAPALAIDRLVRGCTPAPGAWTTFRGDRVKLGPFAQVEGPAGDGVVPPGPGRLAVGRDGVRVGTGAGHVRLGDVQPSGKRMMPALDWARGARVSTGEAFA